MLASVDGEGNSLATVLNLSDEPLKLKKGLEIASCARLETVYLSHEEDQSNDGAKAKANLCSYSYSSSSSDSDILQGKSEFPTDGLREPPPEPGKSALPDIEKLKDELDPEIFEQLEQLLLEYEEVFQKHKADLGRCTVI